MSESYDFLQLEGTEAENELDSDVNDVFICDSPQMVSTPTSSPSIKFGRPISRSVTASPTTAESKFKQMFDVLVKKDINGTSLSNGKGGFKKMAYCKAEGCGKSYIWHGSQTVMTAHFRSAHPGLYCNITRPPGQSHLPFLKDKFPLERVPFVTESCARWICLNGRPITIVEDEGLSNLVNVLTGDPNFSLIKRDTVRRKIMDLFNQHKSSVCEYLKEANGISFTTDIWTSSANKSVISLTCHFIDKDWELVCLPLAVCEDCIAVSIVF